MDLSIIIRSERSHNSAGSGNLAEALLQLLQLEIEAIRQRAAIEVILIDSDTADADLRDLTQQFPSVRIVPSQAELNPPQSYNLGANLARSRTMLFLSADAMLAHGSLLKCVDAAFDHPRTSLFYGNLQASDASATSSEADPSPAGARFEGFDWSHGVPMLVSKSVFLELGGFDESLTELAAQQDLCQRIQAFGREVAHWDEIRAVDLGGPSHG
jgi:GT2 family glycosyltransferase